MIRILRRIVGLALVAVWAWWWLRPTIRLSAGAAGITYPNEWGVRTTPLEGAELVAALELEAAMTAMQR